MDDYQDPFIIQPIKTLPHLKRSDYFSPITLHMDSTFLSDSDDISDISNLDVYDYEYESSWEDSYIELFANDKLSRYPYQEPKFLGNEANSLQVAYSSVDIARKYVEAKTTSVFCPASQIILPETKNSSWSSSDSH